MNPVAAAAAPEQTKAPLRSEWSSRVFSFEVIAALAPLPAIASLSRYDLSDPDIWWHMRNATELVRTHHLVRSDSFSSTAYGMPWINHSWLSELFYYAAHHVLGYLGVTLLWVVLFSLLSIAVYAIARRQVENPIFAALATYAGVAMAAVGFGPRTQHLGALCLVGIFAVLLRYRDRRNAPLWMVPVLFALWINCHGGWLFGFAVALILFAAGVIRRDIGSLRADPWSALDRKRLAATLAASFAALFVNPYGYKLVWYPFDMMTRQKLNLASIEEWATVDFSNAHGRIMLLVIALVCSTLLASRRRWRIDEALLTAFLLGAALLHTRTGYFAGLLLPALLAPNLEAAFSRAQHHALQPKKLLNALVIAAVLGVSAILLPSRDVCDARTAADFPAGALAYLRQHPIAGNMFNDYGWGGYIEWNAPDLKPFVDSRVDIFEYKGVLRDHLDAMRLVRTDEVLAQYDIRYVLYKQGTPLAYYMARNAGWKTVYQDAVAIIFERNNPPATSTFR